MECLYSNVLGRVRVFSGGLKAEGYLSDFCVESGGPIAFDSRLKVSL
jgi:hypothetical protein